jgi:hypothetical protein
MAGSQKTRAGGNMGLPEIIIWRISVGFSCPYCRTKQHVLGLGRKPIVMCESCHEEIPVKEIASAIVATIVK